MVNKYKSELLKENLILYVGHTSRTLFLGKLTFFMCHNFELNYQYGKAA